MRRPRSELIDRTLRDGNSWTGSDCRHDAMLRFEAVDMGGVPSSDQGHELRCNAETDPEHHALLADVCRWTGAEQGVLLLGLAWPTAAGLAYCSRLAPVRSRSMAGGPGHGDHPPAKTCCVMLRSTRIRPSAWSRTPSQNAVFKLSLGSRAKRPAWSSSRRLLLGCTRASVLRALNGVRAERRTGCSHSASVSRRLKSVLNQDCSRRGAPNKINPAKERDEPRQNDQSTPISSQIERS